MRHPAAQRGENIIFLLGAPRSGTTLLANLIAAHDRIASAGEPHILLPLKFAGYYASPRSADYDVINTALAIRELVERLPGKADDYVEACRAFAQTVYGAAIDAEPGTTFFLDKTPAYVLHWRFVVELFPHAKYVVLLRHPAAIWHSIATTFFAGDYALAEREFDVLPEYIEALAAFVEQSSVDKLVLDFQALVADAPEEVGRVWSFLGFADGPPAEGSTRSRGPRSALGDPMMAQTSAGVDPSRGNAWAATLCADASKRRSIEGILERVDDRSLEAIGYPRERLWEPLASVPAQAARRRWSWYLFKRRVYFWLRPIARVAWVRRCLEQLRYHADVLLREDGR